MKKIICFVSLFIFLAGTSCGNDELEMVNELDAPEKIIKNVPGRLHYRSDAQMWAVNYFFPGTIDCVDDYLMPEFQNERNYPTDIYPWPNVRISGSCHQTYDFEHTGFGLNVYYIDITDFVYDAWE
jgi:hypothetical protein